MSKYGMSMCVLGMAEEFRDYGIAVNALWPRTGKYQLVQKEFELNPLCETYLSVYKKIFIHLS